MIFVIHRLTEEQKKKFKTLILSCKCFLLVKISVKIKKILKKANSKIPKKVLRDGL